MVWCMCVCVWGVWVGVYMCGMYMVCMYVVCGGVWYVLCGVCMCMVCVFMYCMCVCVYAGVGVFTGTHTCGCQKLTSGCLLQAILHASFLEHLIYFGQSGWPGKPRGLPASTSLMMLETCMHQQPAFIHGSVI